MGEIITYAPYVVALLVLAAIVKLLLKHHGSSHRVIALRDGEPVPALSFPISLLGLPGINDELSRFHSRWYNRGLVLGQQISNAHRNSRPPAIYTLWMPEAVPEGLRRTFMDGMEKGGARPGPLCYQLAGGTEYSLLVLRN